jgi:hypothetical protein
LSWSCEAQPDNIETNVIRRAIRESIMTLSEDDLVNDPNNKKGLKNLVPHFDVGCDLIGLQIINIPFEGFEDQHQPHVVDSKQKHGRSYGHGKSDEKEAHGWRPS